MTNNNIIEISGPAAGNIKLKEEKPIKSDSLKLKEINPYQEEITDRELTNFDLKLISTDNKTNISHSKREIDTENVDEPENNNQNLLPDIMGLIKDEETLVKQNSIHDGNDNKDDVE